MPDITLNVLRTGDSAALLAFELANRAWFERHIDARQARFYTPDGIAAHIDDYLAQHAQGRWHPLLLRDGGGALIGRANLKQIDAGAGTAEVGYRIGECAGGRGAGSLALRHLIALAKDRYGLISLRAEVLDNNPASAHILEKAGFRRGKFEPHMATVAGRLIDGYHYVLDLRS